MLSQRDCRVISRVGMRIAHHFLQFRQRGRRANLPQRVGRLRAHKRIRITGEHEQRRLEFLIGERPRRLDLRQVIGPHRNRL